MSKKHNHKKAIVTGTTVDRDSIHSQVLFADKKPAPTTFGDVFGATLKSALNSRETNTSRK